MAIRSKPPRGEPSSRRTGVTLEDVAREAGVSLATASRALNGGPRKPSAAMTERVLSAANSLGYSPSALAQAMVRGRTNIVGLIVHDIADPYFAGIAAGVMAAAGSAGALTMVADTRRDPELEINYVRALRQQQARALILAGSRTRNRQAQDRIQTELTAYRSTGGAAAVIGQRRLDGDTVVVNNRAGARDLATTLVRQGHRRFAVLGGPSTLLTSADRVAGFRDGLVSGGIAHRDVAVICDEFSREGGYQAARRWLASETGRYTCLFAVTDVMAVGALAALREAGLQVPADVAVAGFDDIVLARDVVPALTTVHVPLEQLGRDAVGLVLGIGDETPPSGSDLPADVHRLPGRTLQVPLSVVVRDSTSLDRPTRQHS